MTRALALALLVAAGLARADAGAPPERRGPPPPSGTRNVSLWHSYVDGAEALALREAVAAFHRAHPDIQVETLAVAFGAYAPKLEAAIPAGHGPDVFVAVHDRLTSYITAKLVQPLGALPPAALEDFDPVQLDALSAGGQVYGLPFALKCAALFINDRLLPRDPETLEELEALRHTLPAGIYPLALEAENAYFTSALLHAYGGELLDSEGRYRFAGPEAERMVEHLRRLTRERVVPEETSGVLIRQLFGAGRAAAAVSGPWMAPMLPPGLAWRVAPLPRVASAGGAPMVPFSTIEGALLASGAREPEAALTLMRFLAGPEGARIRALRGGQVVSSRTAWKDPELAGNALLPAFKKAADGARPMPSDPRMHFAFEPAERALRKVMRGDLPVSTALAESARRFEDMTRPLPPKRKPTFGLLAVGLALLGTTFAAARTARRPAFRVELARSWPAYRYVAHAALIVVLLVIAPLLVGAGTSFFAGRGTDLHYVGLANYVEILTARGGELLGHGSFWLVLLVTVLWTAVNLALHLAIGVSLALLLNRPTLALRGPYRVLLILPWAVPTYVTALAWKGMFHRQLGAVNVLLGLFGVEPVSWFARFSTAFTANVTTNVWLGFPFMMVITLAALSAIPKDLYEAAAVDGATAWQRFRLITLPLLVPSLAPAVAMGAMWTFNMFNVVFLVSGGEPDGSTEILVSEAYRWAFTRSQQYGYAAAYAVLIFLVLFFGTRLLNRRLGLQEGSS